MSNIQFLRKQVANIQKATASGTVDFEAMAKLHGCGLYVDAKKIMMPVYP